MAGSIQATPRNRLLGLLADGIGGASAWASENNPPVQGLLGLLGVPAVTNTINEMSYGGALGTGSGMTWKPKADTVDALMTALPLGATVGKAAIDGGVAVAKRAAPAIERGLLQAADNLAAPTALNGQAGAVYVGKKKIADNAYHGTGTDFQGRFDPDMAGSANADQHGSYWLTSDWGHARGYSVAADRNNLTKPIVKEANVFMKNPMEVDAMQTAKNIADDVGIDRPKTWEEASELLQYNQWLNDTVWDAKKLGHDGLIVRNTGDAPGTAGGLADHFAIFNANRARFMK